MNDDAVFRSNRPAEETDTPHGTGAGLEGTASTPVDEDKETQVLVLSSDKELSKMLGTALGDEANTSVTHEPRALADLGTESPEFWSGFHIILFEAAPTDEAAMASLRHISTVRAPATRLLAITRTELTLALAKEFMEFGVDEVLPLSTLKPATASATPVAIGETDGENRDGAIIAVSQSRGGIGSTTAALGLAHCLTGACKRKKSPTRRVAFLDLDFQNGNAGAYVDTIDEGGVIDFLKAGQPADANALSSMMVPYSENLDILPSPTEFAPLNSLTPEMVASLLDGLRKTYDIVIIDLPRALVDWIEPILARADKMLLVTDTSVTSVRQSRRLIDFFTDDHVSLPVELVIGQEKKPFSLSEAQNEAAKILERKFEYWLPRDDKAARRASDHGKPVTEAMARSPLGKALQRLSADIEKAHSETTRRRA